MSESRAWNAGPWNVHDVGGDLYVVEEYDVQTVAIVNQNASVAFDANAVLIALAPEMAEALLDMLPTIDHYDEICSGEECCDYEYGCSCKERWRRRVGVYRRVADKLRRISREQALRELAEEAEDLGI